VVSSYPLRAVLHNPNATSNVAKWAAELAEFELDFASHHVIKCKVLADFIVDWTSPASHQGARTSMSQGPELRSSSDPTGLSSSMAPHVSRGRCRDAAPHPSWGPVQVYGAPRL
jgi:hypothetical protein